MKATHRTGWLVLAIVAIVGASIGVQTSIAGAESSTGPEATVGDVIGGAAGPASVPLVDGPDGSTASVAGGTVKISDDPDEGVALVSPDGSAVSMGIPGDVADPPTVEAGNAIYPDVAPDASVVARPVAGGAQELVVIEGSQAPIRYDFPVKVDDDPARLALRPDGAIDVMRPSGDGVVAVIAPPWAKDSEGRPVPTHYAVNGSMVSQVVEHVDVAYPVVADPQFTWGWATGTVYFTRSETLKASTAAGAISLMAGLCAASLATGPFAIALCAGFSAHAGIVALTANYAYSSGKCLKIKVPVFEPGTVSRGDRNCK